MDVKLVTTNGTTEELELISVHMTLDEARELKKDLSRSVQITSAGWELFDALNELDVDYI